jgi:hypothetical protein
MQQDKVYICIFLVLKINIQLHEDINTSLVCWSYCLESKVNCHCHISVLQQHVLVAQV